MLINGAMQPSTNHSLSLAKTFSEFIAANPDLHAILDKLVNDVVERMDIQICAVILRDQDNPRRLYMAAARGLSLEHQKAFNLEEGQGITGAVVATGKPRVVPNIYKEPAYSYQDFALEEKLCSLASIPLRHHENVLGALNAYTRGEHFHDFSEDEIDLLTLLANWTAFALHHNERRETQAQQRRNLIEEIVRETQMLEAQETMIKFVLPKAVRLVGGDSGFLALVDYERLRFEPIYAHQRKIDNVRRLRIGSWHEGISGCVVRTGKAEIVDDVTLDLRYNIRGDHRIHSKLLVPLKYQERVIAIINIDSRKKAAFRESDLKNLEVLAGHLALTLHKQKLDQASKKLGSSFRTIHDLDEIYNTLVRAAAEFIGTNAVALWEKDWEGSFVLRASLGFERFQQRRVKIPAGEGIVAQVTSKRDAVIIDDVTQEQNYLYPEMVANTKLKWMLCLPLFFANEVFAVLDVYSRRPDRFFDQEIAYLKALVSQAEVAIQNAKLIDHFNRIAESLASSKDIRVILENIARSAMEVLCAEPVVLFQYDQAKKKLQPPPILAGKLLQPEGYAEDFVFSGNSFAELIIASGESVYREREIENHPVMQEVKAGDHEGMPKQRFNEREKIQSMAALVLKVEGEIVGLMFLNYRTAQEFTGIEKKIMETFALQAAIAIKNSRLIEQLHTSKEFLRSIVDGVPDPIIVTENKSEGGKRVWKIQLANQAAHEMFGYDFVTKELAGKNARELVGDHLLSLRQALYDSEGELSDFETAFMHKENYAIPISLSTSVLQREPLNHRILKTISISKNLTTRKALEKHLDHLNRATTALLGMATLEQAYDAVFDNLREIGYDKGMISLVEEEKHMIVAQRAVGEGWSKLVDFVKIDLSSDNILAEVVRSGKAQLIDDCANDPRCVPALVRLAEVKAQYVTPLLVQDKVIGALQIDLTDKQDLLKGDKYFLAECLEILSGFANQIAVALEADRHRIRIDKLKLTLADIGHEFGSPLHIILSQLGGLKYYLNKRYETEEFVKKKVKIIEEEASRATRQMRNSLFSAIGATVAAGINLEKASLGDVIVQCAERFFETALNRGIRLIIYDSVKKLPQMYFDKTQMEQVFNNLIDNAVKYSHFNQNIKIEAREIGNKAEISITDRGHGIPESDYERIFQGFIRSEISDPMRYIPGTGLGLMIARDFVQRHKGTIWVKSAPFVKDPRRIQTYDGYKTTFSVTLPFNPKEV